MRNKNIRIKKDSLVDMEIDSTLSSDLILTEQDSTSEHDVQYWLQENND